MQIKTFTAASMSLAMERARDELGHDVVIVSSRSAAAGDDVTVMAAIENQPASMATYLVDKRGRGAIDIVEDILQFHRVPAELAKPICSAARELHAGNATIADPLLLLAGALDMRFSFRPLTPPSLTGPAVIVGPPGSGKTVACAKIAASATLGGRPTRIISMDTARAGTAARIEALAARLSLPLEEACDGAALGMKLAHYPDEAVVVDTPGINFCDDVELTNWRSVFSQITTPIILVIPAGMDAFEAAEQAKVFAELGASGIFTSRLDAAVRYGGMLAAAQAGRLPIMLAGFYPQIGEGLIPLNPVSLARIMTARYAGSSAPFEGVEEIS